MTLLDAARKLLELHDYGAITAQYFTSEVVQAFVDLRESIHKEEVKRWEKDGRSRSSA